MKDKRSLRVAEEKDVSNKLIRLQRGVVADLASNSTNPSAPSIAVQALAGYFIFEGEQFPVPGSLRDIFSDHFTEHTRALTSDPAHIQSQRAKTERYARACEVLVTLQGLGWSLKNNEDIYNHFRVLRLLTPPSNLSEALLCRDTGLGFGRFDIRLDVLIDYILSQGPIPITQVHRWQLRRIFGEIKPQSLNDFSERHHKGLWKALLGISELGNLSLQESVAIWIFQKHFCQEVANSTSKSYRLNHSDSPFQVPSVVRASSSNSSHLLIINRSNPSPLCSHSCLLCLTS